MMFIKRSWYSAKYSQPAKILLIRFNANQPSLWKFGQNVKAFSNSFLGTLIHFWPYQCINTKRLSSLCPALLPPRKLIFINYSTSSSSSPHTSADLSRINLNIETKLTAAHVCSEEDKISTWGNSRVVLRISHLQSHRQEVVGTERRVAKRPGVTQQCHKGKKRIKHTHTSTHILSCSTLEESNILRYPRINLPFSVAPSWT